MNIHHIQLNSYCPTANSNPIYLGTAGSHGNEQLKITRGKGWDNLVVQVIFDPCGVAVLLPADGLLDVPWEATAISLSAREGRIVFQGFDQDRLVNSTDLHYTVSGHNIIVGRNEKPYTPGIVEGVLNQMAADKDAILSAAHQTGQSKEAAAASASEAAGSASTAQQSADAASTSADQAAASAAAANEILTQIQTVGQEVKQKVKDAENEALDKIAAAAPALPAISTDSAWQSITVKSDGTRYNLTSLAPISATIRPTVSGNPAVCENSAAWGLQKLKIYGRSTQDGTPSPENPVPIMSAGDGGSVDLSIGKKNLFSINKVLEGLSTSRYLIDVTDDEFTITVIKESIGTLIYFRVPIEVPVGSTVTISGNTTGSRMFSLQNRNLDGSLAQGEPLVNTITRKPGFSVFAVCNPLGLGETVIPEGATATFSKVMVNYGDSALPWEPYIDPQKLTFSTPSGLPGIPVEGGGNYTDSIGQQWLCDVVNNKSKLQIVSKVVLSPDMDWKESGNKHWYYTDIKDAETKEKTPCLCSHFILSKNGWNDYPASENSIVLGNGLSGVLGISKAKFDDIEALKLWLAKNTVEVFYPLKNPVVKSLSGKEMIAYRAMTTYDGATVISTSEDVAGLEVQYTANGTQYLQSVIDRIAALEAVQTGV